jgi:precorrin-3B synthase
VIQLHQAADGGLARIRVPGGRLTAAQWQCLIEVAVADGDAHLELTSRGNVQIRGLGALAERGVPVDSKAHALTGRLHEAGLLPSLTHERVRNIAASPLSGRDRAGFLDVGPLIAELDRGLCATSALAELPGRFLFALDDGRTDVAGLSVDITAIAVDGRTFALLLAGVDSGVRISADEAVAAMLAAAQAFLDERSAQGSPAWRLSELVNGPARIAARLRASTSGVFATLNEDDPPLIGGFVGATGVPALGEVRQSDGKMALVTAVPFGRLDAEQAGALSGHELIVTPWRSIVLPDIPAIEAANRARTLTALGFTIDPSSAWTGVTACAGRPGCARALADVRADGLAVHSRMPASPTPVHWVGCERRCGQPSGASVTVLATASGYRISRGLVAREVAGTTEAISAAIEGVQKQS